MSYYEATEQTPTDDDLWHVQLASGEVCMMTLEQLDDAFQNGVIHENTYLWQEGATGWVTLREVAGLDSDEPEDLSAHAEPQTNPFVQPDYASESVWPAAAPVQNFAAQDPFAPPVQYAPPLQVMGPHSTAPVVSPLRDMDFDLEPVDFGRKKHPGRWLFAAALVAAAGFGAVKYNLIPTSHSDASPVPPSVAAIPLPVETAAPTPPPPTPAAAPAPEPAKPALTDDVKQRLASADQKLADKQKAKQQQAQQRHSAARSSSRRSSGGSSGAKGVFSKGGETGDPLNSSL